MKGNGYMSLPRSGKTVFIRKGSVSHAVIHRHGKRIVELPYRDNGNGTLTIISDRLTFKEFSRLDMARKIVWIEVEEMKNFLPEGCTFCENRVCY